MPVDGDREVLVERRVVEPNRTGGSIASAFIVLCVLTAVAFGWWAVGTAPVPANRVSQSPPATTSPDTTVEPRTTLPEGAVSGKAL